MFNKDSAVNKSEMDRHEEGRDKKEQTLLIQEEFTDLKNRLIDFSAQNKKKDSAFKTR